MALNINQFSQSVVKGLLDMKFNPNTMTCRISATEAAPLVPGQAVKRVNSGGPGTLPEITAVTADTDDIFGFVSYNIKESVYGPSEACEVSTFTGNVMYMEAGATFAPQAKLGVIVAGATVQTAAATDRIIGIALDKANAIGDLVRVYINLPGATA